ncbi:MAG: 2-amino-4-hydroxy-6-hydroxymethyldihydropteridine diphosphokinase [Pseudomonadota bacterium]
MALGSNMRVAGIGPPRGVLGAALEALKDEGLTLHAIAPLVESAPIGPSHRRYANSAAVVECDWMPPDLLALFQRIERRFGRGRAQRRGQRWRARALDLDIILWDKGVWASPTLTIPHREMRNRDFVLGPASEVAGAWRDPVTGLTLAQLASRLARKQKGRSIP